MGDFAKAQALVKVDALATRHQAQFALALEGIFDQSPPDAVATPRFIYHHRIHVRRAIAFARDTNEAHHVITRRYRHRHTLDTGNLAHTFQIGEHPDRRQIVLPRRPQCEQFFGHSFPHLTVQMPDVALERQFLQIHPNLRQVFRSIYIF